MPLAGIDPDALKEIMASSQKGLLECLTCSQVEQLLEWRYLLGDYAIHIFINHCSIINRGFDYFKNLKDQEKSVEKITQITRYGTVLIACLQGYGVSVGLENAGNLVSEPGLSFRIITTISLVAGTTFLMWLGEQITLRG